MGFRDRLKGLREPSESEWRQPARGDESQDVETRLAALEKLRVSGSITPRELEQARRRILDGKD